MRLMGGYDANNENKVACRGVKLIQFSDQCLIVKPPDD